jgi:hydroxymethylpyrimidine pyrophosphatase-like HAD family hydrolase
MRIAIYDMDGTIVNSLHRYRTIKDANGVEKIDLAFWRANEDKAYDDSLLPLAEQYKADMKDPNCYVIIATARVMGDADWRFVQDKLGMPNYFISRKNGDSISGGTLKVNGLRKLFNLKQFKTAKAKFYEDNISYMQAVCNAYKNVEGVFCPSLQGH